MPFVQVKLRTSFVYIGSSQGGEHTYPIDQSIMGAKSLRSFEDKRNNCPTHLLQSGKMSYIPIKSKHYNSFYIKRGKEEGSKTTVSTLFA